MIKIEQELINEAEHNPFNEVFVIYKGGVSLYLFATYNQLYEVSEKEGYTAINGSLLKYQTRFDAYNSIIEKYVANKLSFAKKYGRGQLLWDERGIDTDGKRFHSQIHVFWSRHRNSAYIIIYPDAKNTSGTCVIHPLNKKFVYSEKVHFPVFSYYNPELLKQFGSQAEMIEWMRQSK